MKNQFKKRVCYLLIVILVLSFFNYKLSYAASLTSLSDVMSRNKISTLSNHTITFTTPSGVSAAQTITVIFPSDFAPESGIDYTDVDVSDDGADLTLATSASGTTWGAAFGGTGNRTLTITSDTGTIAASSIIVIEIGTHAAAGATGDKQITNTTTTGSKTISLTAGIDTGDLAVVIFTEDQISVSASVQPTLSFAISDTSIGAGDIDTANIYYATSNTNGSTSEPTGGSPSQLTASTNAVNGLTISIKSDGNGTSGAGMYSSTLSDLIEAAASTAVAANSDGYGVYGKSASSLTIAEAYDNDSASDSAITRSFTTFSSTNGPVNGGTVDLSIKMGVGATTKAGSYTDTLTLVCLGNF